jgi:asparaginyl-tRNA synthetase
MDLAEEMLKYICQYVMENCADDLKFLNDREAGEQQSKPQNERNEMTLIERLQFVTQNDFKRITYTEAIDLLRNSTPTKKGSSNTMWNGELICRVNTSVTL